MDIGKIEFAKYDAFTSTIEQVRKERGLASPSKEAPPIPDCIPPAKSAEEMLKKALEFAKDGMAENEPIFGVKSDYEDGKFRAFEDMEAHLEMLIEEAKQNG